MNYLNSKQLRQWFLDQQQDGGLTIELSEKGLAEPWEMDAESAHPLHRSDNSFHRAVAVQISPTDSSSSKKPWSQFMVEMMDTREYKGLAINGIILLARTEREGKKYYLVQAKAEGGALDQMNSVFLTTTIQASFSNVQMNPGKIPLWDQLAPGLLSESDQLMVAPSIEDPGIFYGKHNLLVLYDLSFEEVEKLSLPNNYTWADREAIRELQLSGDAAQFIADVLGTFE